MDHGWIHIFEGVGDSPDIRAALAASRRIPLADGQMLLAAGAENHHLYILASGRMEVRLTRDETHARMHIAPGEVFGEMSIIDGRCTSAYVYSAGESEVLAIHETDFWRYLAPHPSVMRNLIRLMTQRLRQNSEIMIRGLEQQLKLEHLEKELSAARDIQMGLLPHAVPLFPRHGQVDVHGHLTPATEVGGDLFDAFPLGEDHILVAVGDVSGKGMPAALFMMRTLTLLRAQGCAPDPRNGLIATLNRLLCEGNDTNMFVTLCVAILSLRDGLLTLFNGGHPPPLLSRQGCAFEPVENAKGAILGISDQVNFRSHQITLAPGDRLVLYSDGVTEAENEARDMFALDGARACLDRHPADAGARGLVDALAAAVAKFSGAADQSDDITILALRYLGPGAT